MYKVVIVDDEPLIVEGLRKIVDWEKYGCIVVGEGHSGKEGLALVNKHEPDILFTDIRMPGMDGLTMIAALRSEHQDMQVVVLTGYRDFEYARSALNLGVQRYLVKPSKMKELDEAMTGITERLEKMGASRGRALDTEQHYREKLQLPDVAEKVYVSHWHLSKLLNSTGKSFSELLNEIRIENAKKLMEDSSLHISDIAERVGFADTAHFSRVFKKCTGISAGEYRNKFLR